MGAQSGTWDVPAGLQPFVDGIAKRIAHFILKAIKGTDNAADFVDQWSSPLGPRNHCAAVRRRIGERKPGADIVGRRHLLSPEALREELSRQTERRSSTVPAGEPDPLEHLERRLSGLFRGGR